MFVDRYLAFRLENAHAWRGVHYAHAQHSLMSHADIPVLSVGGAQVIYAGPGSPLNRAVGLGLNGAVTPADLDTLEGFYVSHKIPTRIDLCPLADPSLLKLVSQRGYRPEEFSSVLACSLPVETPPADIEITVACPAQADVWIRTTAQGFEDVDEPSVGARAILGPNFFSANATCFLASIDGEPVGGGGMYIHAGVAEFGGASTRVAFRRRGVQTALLHHRLAAAYAAGCDLAMVLTEPGSASQRNAERVGFRLAYTKVTLVEPA